MKELTVFLIRQENRKSDDLLKAAASCYTGLEPDGFETVRAWGKKPRFRFHPELYASVSHSGGMWACAMTTEDEVGLDIQIRTPPVRMERIARRYFHPSETAAVLSADDPAGEFFRIWCRKEAAAKQSGRGIDRRFAEFCSIRGGREQDASDPAAGGPFEILGRELYLTEFRIPDRPEFFCCTAAPFPHEIRQISLECEI